MDEMAGRAAHAEYDEPRIEDYGTLAELTADAAPLLMRQLGVMGAAQVTAPAAPGDGGGGGGGGGDVGGVVATPDAPREAGGGEDQGIGIGGEVVPPDGGGEADGGEPGAAGPTAEGGVGAERVAGADELPFTGLDVAATAALGAAATAAGVALRKALDDDAAAGG